MVSESCCCNHGGRCTCSHKKEPTLDTVAESESDNESQRMSKSKPIVSRRRRANTTHSEPMLNFDEHGHHKPVHKLNKPSHKTGPYSLTRGASLHSVSSSSSPGSKSVDSPHNQDAAKLQAVVPGCTPDQAGSGHASPTSSFQQLNGQLPPLDLSSIRYPEYPASFDLFNGLPDQEPIFSAGLSTGSVDWTQYDLELNGDGYAPSSFDQAQSYNGFDPAGSTEPTLASNSGDVSETEDFVSAFSDSQLDGFHTGAVGSYLNMSQSQGSMLTGCDLGNLDYDQFKGTAAASKFLPTATTTLDDPSPFAFTDEEGLWNMNSFNDGISQSPDPVASGLWDV